MAEPLLALDGVHTHIGQYHILQGVTFAVAEGGVTVLLGRNGAGKTTTLRTIMGLWRASRGSIRFASEDIGRLDTPAVARRGIGYVPESLDIFTGLTVEENVAIAAREGPLPADRLDWIFSLFPPLKTFWRLPAGNLSGGQKQMLAIARAMAEPRRLILIDEPTKGLAPAIVATMAGAQKELKAEGATILLVEQNFAVARLFGDSCAVMDDGQVTWSGAMADLAADPALQERLMGLSLEAQ
jgi:branched-chain amino acid transport system ATP-binding protein